MIDKLYAIGMTDAMITSSAITIGIIIVALLLRKNVGGDVPHSIWHNMVEMGLEMNHGFFRKLMGEHLCKRYYCLVGTLFIYILICNYSGLLPLSGKLPGLQAPTSDINFPCGMAILVIILVQVIGIREHRGMGTYKRFITPFIFMLPLMLMDELAKPISLTLRLYGNTFGDEQVVEVLSELCPLILPTIMQALVIILALIQALVFSLLTAIYIGEACEGSEEKRLPDHFEEQLIPINEEEEAARAAKSVETAAAQA